MAFVISGFFQLRKSLNEFRSALAEPDSNDTPPLAFVINLDDLATAELRICDIISDGECAILIPWLDFLDLRFLEGYPGSP